MLKTRENPVFFLHMGQGYVCLYKGIHLDIISYLSMLIPSCLHRLIN